MDEYDQFDIEYTGKLLFRGFIGLIIATILSFIFYLLLLQETAFRVFKGITQFNQSYNIAVNPVITSTLVVLMMGLVSPTTYFFPVFGSQATMAPMAISAIIIWIFVGIVVGFISKNSWKGAEAGFMAPLFTFIAAVIFALISVFSIGLLAGGTLAAFGWFLVIVGSAYLAALSFGISMFFGFIGGYIGSKLLEKY